MARVEEEGRNKERVVEEIEAIKGEKEEVSSRLNELELEYNKARQEAITTELIEIISGVESMK